MTADAPESTGATVYVAVKVACVGEALHHLEYHADIHLLDRVPEPQGTHEIWVLRSDRFPRAWDKRDAMFRKVEGRDGLLISVV